MRADHALQVAVARRFDHEPLRTRFETSQASVACRNRRQSVRLAVGRLPRTPEGLDLGAQTVAMRSVSTWSDRPRGAAPEGASIELEFRAADPCGEHARITPQRIRRQLDLERVTTVSELRLEKILA